MNPIEYQTLLSMSKRASRLEVLAVATLVLTVFFGSIAISQMKEQIAVIRVQNQRSIEDRAKLHEQNEASKRDRQWLHEKLERVQEQP